MVTLEYRVEVTLTLQEAQELRLVLGSCYVMSDKLLHLYQNLCDTLPELVV